MSLLWKRYSTGVKHFFSRQEILGSVPRLISKTDRQTDKNLRSRNRIVLPTLASTGDTEKDNGFFEVLPELICFVDYLFHMTINS